MLLSHDHLHPLLTSMGEHLLSDRPENDVSNYILDLVGMGEMDLVVQIMSNRQAIGQAVSEKFRCGAKLIHMKQAYWL
jgi:hypothetical protein